MPSTKKTSRKRTATVIAIPKENNRVYGPDVPIHWKEAARQTGIPERTFRKLIDRREISVLNHPGRVMVKPSAIREYLDGQEVKRV